MNEMPERVKPDPIPAIHPVWEYNAEGPLVERYGAYKAAFQVPWVGVVSMAYAHYRRFFDVWWGGLSELVQSRAYVECAFALRAEVENAVRKLNPPPICTRLQQLGYSNLELGQIRDAVEFFSHGNFIQVPAVFAARLLLEGGALTGGDHVIPYNGRHAPQTDTPFILMEPHHVADGTRQVYQDIMTRLSLPFVNTDYRALARWPTYFEMAWGDLAGVTGTREYEALALDMHTSIFKAVAALPNPGGLDGAQLLDASNTDSSETDSSETGASAGEVLEVTRLFTWLLPGLVVNVAYFKAQLDA